MKLAPFLENAVIDVDVHTPSCSSLIRMLVGEIYESGISLDVDRVVDEIMKRESACSTGVGRGLAIPHATIRDLDSTHMAIATLADPIDFNAVDRRPVRLVIMLISPPGMADLHIALLARIARMCSKEIFMELMMQAPSRAELLQLLMDEDDRIVG